MLGVDSWGWFSYKIRWRLWSRTAAEATPGARRFVAQNGFCGTKTHLARPQNRRCPYPEHLHSIHASVREGIAR